MSTGPSIDETDPVTLVLQGLKALQREKLRWSAEKAAYEARIAAAERDLAQKDQVHRDLIVRIKMLEWALSQERARAVQSSAGQPPATAQAAGPGTISRGSMMRHVGVAESEEPTRTSTPPRVPTPPAHPATGNPSAHLHLHARPRALVDPSGPGHESGSPEAVAGAGSRGGHPASRRASGEAAAPDGKEGGAGGGEVGAGAGPGEQQRGTDTQGELRAEMEANLEMEAGRGAGPGAGRKAGASLRGLQGLLGPGSKGRAMRVSAREVRELLFEGPSARRRPVALAEALAAEEAAAAPSHPTRPPGPSPAAPEPAPPTPTPPNARRRPRPAAALPPQRAARAGGGGGRASPPQWRVRHGLRSHFDCVRAVEFHGTEAALLSASDDGTCKLWNLRAPLAAAAAAAASRKQPLGPLPLDVEPMCSLRGHRGPVLCATLCGARQLVVTGGLDGTVRAYRLPELRSEGYGSVGEAVGHKLEVLRGHEEAVWALALHPHEPWLLSAAPDAPRLWRLQGGAPPGPPASVPLALAPEAPGGEAAAATSLDWARTEARQALVAYTSGAFALFDAAAAAPSPSSPRSGPSPRRPRPPRRPLPACPERQINKIVSHGALRLAVTAHEDRRVGVFDLASGKCAAAFLAHGDGVSTVALDPSGLYVASGSHDGSIRVWDLRQPGSMVQEFAAHRPKFDEAVLSLAFHPNMNLMASGGADSIVRLYSAL
eukprot:tig00020537_g10246.t1